MRHSILQDTESTFTAVIIGLKKNTIEEETTRGKLGRYCKELEFSKKKPEEYTANRSVLKRRGHIKSLGHSVTKLQPLGDYWRQWSIFQMNDI